LELALDVLQKLQDEKPRFNHRFTIEHFGVSNLEQVRRIKDLGAIVSANVYYVHELGEAYWQKSIGHERASQMARLGSLERAGIPFALHSDFTMAPAMPLNSAWVAVNRVGESGAVLCSEERISVDAAMRAITIDAAYIIGMEDEIGSIRAGKKADFTVLEQDPWEVDPMQLRNIPIWGTVFEGTPFPIQE
jgi:predicted amidohydrolase YtcJ